MINKEDNMSLNLELINSKNINNEESLKKLKIFYSQDYKSRMGISSKCFYSHVHYIWQFLNKNIWVINIWRSPAVHAYL